MVEERRVLKRGVVGREEWEGCSFGRRRVQFAERSEEEEGELALR